MEQVKANQEESVINYNFADFALEEVLNNNTGRKMIILLGKFQSNNDNKAIIILEKTAFSKENFETTIDEEAKNPENENGNHCSDDDLETKNSIYYFSQDLKSTTDFINNIYGSFNIFPQPELNGVKATVIYPATEKHIEKYSVRRKHLIRETPALYKNITEPYIEASGVSLEWVYNILDHKQEVDRIIYEDNDPEIGFILLPDLKWDGSKETLYTLAIPHKRGIKSIRDLNETHLPLLKNIRKSGSKAILEKFDMDESQLRIYFHYQPQFYHIHVHFTALNNEAPGINCEKSHLLDTVINNIELIPDYYQKATLQFVGHEGNELLVKFLNDLKPNKNDKPIKSDNGVNDNELEEGNQRKKLKFSNDE